MSNPVFVNVIRTTIEGEEAFGILVRDGYGSAFDVGYPTMEAFLEEYPTKQHIINWIPTQTAFEGSEYRLAAEYDSAEDGVFPVIIEGYPE